MFVIKVIKLDRLDFFKSGAKGLAGKESKLFIGGGLLDAFCFTKVCNFDRWFHVFISDFLVIDHLLVSNYYNDSKQSPIYS